MAECNDCLQYLSAEDIIQQSVICSSGKTAIRGTLLNQNEPIQQAFLPTGTIVTKNGEMIVLAGDSNFILTVDGFQPLELLIAGGFPAMANEKLISK